LGKAYRDLGDNNKAIELLSESFRISKKINDKLGVCYASFNLGIAYKNLGKRQKATESFEKALEISKEIGNDKLKNNIKLAMQSVQ